MTRSRLDFALGLVAAVAACTDAASPAGDTARLRVVNSVFQGTSAATAVPVAVDVLIDSSLSGAGLAALAAASISPGSGSDAGAGAHGTTNLFPAAGYRDFPSGVHSFVARLSGTSASFFRTSDGEYLPRQYMLPFPYTFVLAGFVPDTTPADPGAVPWAMIVDDPFTPPADSARLQVINAAPMADPSGQGTDITVTFDDGAGDVYTATVPYRATSGYVNPAPGTYTLTLTNAASDTLYTGTVTLAVGEVRTFIVQSTAYAATPGPGNTKVTNLLDNQW